MHLSPSVKVPHRNEVHNSKDHTMPFKFNNLNLSNRWTPINSQWESITGCYTYNNNSYMYVYPRSHSLESILWVGITPNPRWFPDRLMEMICGACWIIIWCSLMSLANHLTDQVHNPWGTSSESLTVTAEISLRAKSMSHKKDITSSW